MYILVSFDDDPVTFWTGTAWKKGFANALEIASEDDAIALWKSLSAEWPKRDVWLVKDWGQISEFTIATAGFAAGKVIPVVLFLAIIAVIFIGFIYYGSRMVFGEPHHSFPGVRLPRVVDILIGSLVLMLLVLGTIIPPWLWLLIQNAAKVLQG